MSVSSQWALAISAVYVAVYALLGTSIIAALTGIEVALKMSFHYWRNSGRGQKQRFVTLTNSYHGETVAARPARIDNEQLWPVLENHSQHVEII